MGTDSVLIINTESVCSNIFHKSFKTWNLLIQNSHFDHRNFDTDICVNQPLGDVSEIIKPKPHAEFLLISFQMQLQSKEFHLHTHLFCLFRGKKIAKARYFCGSLSNTTINVVLVN